MQQTILDEAPTVRVIDLELEPKAAQLPALAAAANEAPTPDPWSTLQSAMQRGLPPETIDKMMALAERMEAMRERERLRQCELAFRRDFAAFTGENIIIPKTKTVNRGNAGSFDQAEFDKVMGMLKPPLSKHGFGIRHDEKFGAKEFPPTELNPSGICPWVWVTCFLEHREGHVEKLELDGPSGDLQANTTLQNQQASASYLKRQSALSITGTPTAEEDNEERLQRKDKGSAKQGEFEELLEAGKGAAVNGSDHFINEWWKTLTNHQRGLLSKEFPKLKKTAEQHDTPVDHSQEQSRSGDFGDDTLKKQQGFARAGAGQTRSAR